MEETNTADDRDGLIPNLPYGLDKNSIAPSTLEKLSKEGTNTIKLVAGRKRKNPFNQYKEEIEAKKRRAENETAEFMDDFINSFEGEKPRPTSRMAFIKGGIEGGKFSENSSPGDLYQPKPRYHTPSERKRDVSSRERSRSRSPPRRKKRAIDELKEEFSKEQQNRGHREHYGRYSSGRNSRDSYSLDDSRSTNLFVTNLSPLTTEEELYDLFSRHGPVASVKIMWPYSTEEQARKRNRGFVAFLNRNSAEDAINSLRGLMLHGNELGIGWGKSVRLPSQPMNRPVSQSQRGSTNTSKLVIVSPHLDRVRDLITKLAEFVAKNGSEFESKVLQAEINNPDFLFLQRIDSPEYLYYKWRVYSFQHGGTIDSWDTAPFQFTSGGASFLPPPLPRQERDLRGSESSWQRDQQNSEKVLVLTAEQIQAIDRTLNELTASRNDIMMAMGFIMRYTEQAAEVCEMIRKHILSTGDVSLSSKLACLYLISDILYNSSIVPKAASFRNLFQGCLEEIFKHLHEAFKAITGRISSNSARERVLKVIQAWNSWSLYPEVFLMNLRCLFTSMPVRDNTSPSNQQDESKDKNAIAGEPEFDGEGDVDGVPIDVDGVPIDVDGVPIDVDGFPIDVDGKPLGVGGEEFDVDGVPIDVDGEPMEIDLVPIDIDGEPLNVDDEEVNVDGEPLDVGGEELHVGEGDFDGVSLDVDGEELNIDSEEIDVEALNVDGEPLNIDGEEINVDGEPLDIDDEEINVGGEPLNVDGEEINVDGESLNGEPLNVDGEELDVDGFPFSPDSSDEDLFA